MKVTPNRIMRAGVLMAVLAALFVVVLPQDAAAQGGFACFGDVEDFDSGFLPSGWTEANLYSMPWQTTTWWGRPNYTGGSGNAAATDSDIWYSDVYDTSLISPSFSTVGFRDVILNFDTNYQDITSSSGYDYLDMDYRIGSGPWTNAESWNEDHGSFMGTGVNEDVDISAARNNSSVQIRFRSHNLNGGWDWYAQVDNVQLICAYSAPDFEDIPVEFLDPEEPCLTGRASFTFQLENVGDFDMINRPGPEFFADFQSEGGGQIVARSITSGVGPGQIPGSSPLGGTATADLEIPVGGMDTVRVTVSFPQGIGSIGEGLFIRRGTWFDMNDNGMVDPGEMTEFINEDPIPFECEQVIDPNAQLGKEVHLPILNFQGMDDVCRTWIEVQNVGSEYKKAVLVTWGEPGFCPPQCAGPLKVECSGLLKPGSTWNFLGAQVPTGSKSGMVFQFSAKQLSEVGVDLGFDDVVADLMCETLFFGVVGDCDDYRRFKKAYEENGDFAGIPMNDRVKGDGILAVDVLRHCPGDVTPGVEVSSKYNGIAGRHLGAYDPVFGGYAYYVPLLYADKAGFNSVMYIQNGGLECTSVELWFKAQDDCLRARICEIFTLAPGESYQFDSTDCVGPDWQGSAWLRSTQPLGIAVDIIGRDVMMTYIGEPAQLNYTYDPEEADFTVGNQVAYGPLIYSEYQGWDSGLQVQNLSSVTAAKVKVYFLDRSGDVITTLVDWICPRGSQTFFLPVVHNMPGNWVGTARVESQEWWTPGDPMVYPPYIVGVATLIKYNDAARGEAQEAIAYNLLPEHKAFDWQIGYGAGGTESGVGLLAIPSLLKDLDATGVTTEIAIQNVVPKPGFTDFAIFIYDQNGLLDFVCEKLNEKQVEYINLQTWGYVNPGFKGSAIVSAVFWEHEVFDKTGFFLRNLVGLAGVSVERTGTALGEDVPGDEAAGSRAIPFREQDIEDAEFSFGFQGPAAPLCPGLPDTRMGAEGCDPDQFDQSFEFNMGANESIALVQPGLPTIQCASGPGWVNRYWDNQGFDVTPCAPVVCTGEMTACSIAPYPGYPIVNILVYSEPRAPVAPFCENLIDSSSDNVAGSFHREFEVWVAPTSGWHIRIPIRLCCPQVRRTTGTRTCPRRSMPVRLRSTSITSFHSVPTRCV